MMVELALNAMVSMLSKWVVRFNTNCGSRMQWQWLMATALVRVTMMVGIRDAKSRWRGDEGGKWWWQVSLAALTMVRTMVRDGGDAVACYDDDGGLFFGAL